REVAENVVALVVEGRAADLDEPGVVGAAVECQLTQPGRIEDGRRGRTLAGRLVEAAHSWMFGDGHGDLVSLYMQLGREKNHGCVNRRAPAHRVSWPSYRAGRPRRHRASRWPGVGLPARRGL